MKKLTIFSLILLCVLICYFSVPKNDGFSVIKILSASDFYIDFNKNNVADVNELVQLFDLIPDDTKLSKTDTEKLNYLGREFAIKTLLGKKVRLIKDDNQNVSVVLADGKNYKNLLIEKGFFFTPQNYNLVRKNLDSLDENKLVSYNPYSKKYHKFNCPHAFSSMNYKILLKDELPKDAKPCKFCHTDLIKISENKEQEKNYNYPKDVYEKYSPLYKDKYMEFYVTDFTKYYYPSSKCLTTACQSLLKEINSARKTIDFAIYGIDNQAEITNALKSAQKRGVKIRWIYDTDKKGNTIYSETFILKKVLSNAKSDIDYSSEIRLQNSNIKDAIMHNKFFIIDKQKVWTGSANISHTDLSGFNANSAVLINSSDVAEIYQREFEQFFSGKFHSLKNKTLPNETVLSSSTVSVYFSPQDKVIEKQIIPIINNSKKYVYIPVFVITHKNLNTALINAKNRGVDVRIIVDATSAASRYSSVKLLRSSGIKVKTENRAGKMHMKSAIIDDKYVIVGSMNFTKSGEAYNDENILIIKNTQLAKAFKQKFLYFYNAIPDKWLYKNPQAESENSINSCHDGIDNDFDGDVDMKDSSCSYSVKKYPAKKI